MKITTSTHRQIRFQKSVLPHAEGSCLVSMGKTTVLCVASVEDKPPFHAEEKKCGWVHAEYSMLPRSGLKRSPRERVSSGGRSQEISRLIGRALRAAVHLPKLYPYSIIIDCDVLRADGGTRTAAINGGFVALSQALKTLYRGKMLACWPLKYHVAAVSCGIVGQSLVMDMDYEKDSQAEADLNVVMSGAGELIEIQGTAEKAPFSQTQLNTMINLSRVAIKKVVAVQRRVLGALP